MQLQKIHLSLAVLLFVYGFFVMIGFSIAISNKQSCKDDLPIYPTPGCNYDGAQAIIFIILALLSVLAAPLGFFITYWVYAFPALFSAISIIMNIVYMLRYRTNNNWQFQLQQGKKKVWAQQMRYLAMSCAFFLIVFILFFFGKLRNQLVKKKLDEAAKDLQTPQRVNKRLSQKKSVQEQEEEMEVDVISPRINQNFDQDTTQNQINNHVFK